MRYIMHPEKVTSSWKKYEAGSRTCAASLPEHRWERYRMPDALYIKKMLNKASSACGGLHFCPPQ